MESECFDLLKFIGFNYSQDRIGCIISRGQNS